MNFSFPLFILIVLLLSGCRPETSKGDQKTGTLTIELECEHMESHDGIPESAIYAHVGENRVKILELPDCEVIDRSRYIELQIPETAVAAAGGRWAGSGQYVYAQQEEQKILFYKGSIDESDGSGHIQYQPLVIFEKGKFYFQ